MTGARKLLDRTLELRGTLAQLVDRAEAGLRTEEAPHRQLELLGEWKRAKAHYEQVDALGRGLLRRQAAFVSEHLRGHVAQMESVSATRTSENGDITVKVDMNGQIQDLWLEPGILDRTTAAEIAEQITGLVSTAGQQTAEQVARIFQAAHEFPDVDTMLATRENPPGAEPETAPQPR